MKKNENYPKYVQAMRLMDDGKSIRYVERHLKMGRGTLWLIRQRYLLGGELALLQPDHQCQTTFERKVEIVKDIEENGLSLHDASLKYDILKHTLGRWLRAYHANGEAGLKRKRPQAIKTQEKAEEKLKEQERKRREKADLAELERLRKRNEYLEAENALLKKVKALVEEREARLRAIGQKPSKD